MTARNREPIYALSAGVAFRDIEGQILILKGGEDVLQTVNAAGAFIWKRLAKRQPLTRISRALAAEYRLDQARARSDVDAFVADLKAHGLIRKHRA